MTDQWLKNIYSNFIAKNQYTLVKITKNNSQVAFALLNKIVNNILYFINYEDDEGFVKDKELSMNDIKFIDFIKKEEMIENIKIYKEIINLKKKISSNNSINSIKSQTISNNLKKKLSKTKFYPNRNLIKDKKYNFKFNTKMDKEFSTNLKESWVNKNTIQTNNKIEIDKESNYNYNTIYENLSNYHTGYRNILMKYSEFDYTIPKEKIIEINKIIKEQTYN